LASGGPRDAQLRAARRHHEILEERYGSTIITSLRSIKNWHEISGRPSYADAHLIGSLRTAGGTSWLPYSLHGLPGLPIN
jgi:hypothetical protein